jgi:hypothetical protein
MIFDAKGGAFFYVAQESIERFIFLEVEDCATATADEVMVMMVITGEVGVTASALRVFVYAPDGTDAAKQLKGAEDGGPPDGWGVGLYGFQQFGRCEWERTLYYLVDDHAAGCGNAAALFI